MMHWLFQLVSQLLEVDGYSPIKHTQQSILNVLNGGATIVEECSGVWQVEYRGSFWLAYSSKPSVFHKGDVVQVVGQDGINLVIEKAEG